MQIVPKETDIAVLARFGKHPAVVAPDPSPAVVDAVRAAAKKMIQESESNLAAAEATLEMLKREQTEFAQEVATATENFAARVGEYLQAASQASHAMAAHREAIIAVAEATANEPSRVTSAPAEPAPAAPSQSTDAPHDDEAES